MISAVIPAYNEEGCILEFAERLYAQLEKLDRFEIIFMVGGTDHTYSILQKWREMFKCSNVWIVYERERGLGSALRKGFNFVHRHSDWILTMDSDLQQLPEEISNLWQYRIDWDLIIGSKGLIDSRGRFKRFVSKCLYQLYRSIHRIKVRDMGSNFRLYARWLVKNLPKDAPKGFKFEQWALLQAVKMNAAIVEIDTTFNPRTTGKSKMSMWRELRERLI